MKSAGRDTAAGRLREALGDLSRRPPDSAGAITHAMGAMEALARDLTGLSNKTFGEIIKRRPNLFPPALGAGLEKFWGFASEEARHVKEGRNPSVKDAELVMRLVAALIVYVSNETLREDLGA